MEVSDQPDSESLPFQNLPRKRGRPPKYTKIVSGTPDLFRQLDIGSSPKKRGRPPKVATIGSKTSKLLDSGTPNISHKSELHALPRKRGRPPKQPKMVSGSSNALHQQEIRSLPRKRGRPSNLVMMGSGVFNLLGSGTPDLSHHRKIQALPRKRGRPPKYTKIVAGKSIFLNNSQSRTGSGASHTQIENGDINTSVAEGSPMDDAELNKRIETAITTKRRGRSKHAFASLESPSIRQASGGAHEGIAGKKRKEMNVAKDRLLEGNKGAALGRGLMRYKSQPGTPGSATVLPMQIDENVRGAPFMDAVVKVFCVHTEPNFSLPWQRKRQFSSNSSGFIISGRRLLTNAHSVEHHTQVKVKKRGSDMKFLATVLAIGTECDIAMLTVNDDEFWEGVPPVVFGALPNLQDAVTVVGYPIGGDTISVTSGVVSRIEVTSYVHGATELLGVQIDAAINAGNSGGPAFNNKAQCVGIAFQSLKHEDAENIGYVIPTPVITHFIHDYQRTEDYTGFPILGIEWQKMENPDLRKALGMASNQKGVRVRRVEPTAPAAEFMQSSDILLSFDDINIANDGTVPFRHGERIGFSYLVSQKYTGEKARIQILREGKSLEFDVELATHKRLVPAHIKGKPPAYYIVAGIVFAAVSVPYLRSEYGKDYDYDSPVKLLDKLLHSMAQTADEQLVLVSQVLVADINIGYEEIVNTQVIALNGVPVKNLKHLAQMVETCKEKFLRVDLEYEQILVLDTEKAKAATPDILATHCIPSAMSDNLKT